MKDFSQLLLDKIDTIIEDWLVAVRQDEQIESARYLPHKALLDNLPRVLRAMATVLSHSQDNDIQTLVQATLEHGVVRAEQGYDALEIAREYRLVRWVIFSTLEEELLLASPLEVMRASRLINTVIDEAIARCFKSYTQQRFQELQQLQSQLQLSNQELIRIFRESQETFSELSHSLKTPLSSVIEYSNLLLQQNAEIKDNYQSLRQMEQVLLRGRQFLHLLNDALEFSRYELGKMQLHPTPTNIKHLINNVMETMEPLAGAKELQLLINCDRAPDEVLTDALRLQQIVTNLISNAIHNTETGIITVVCQLLSDTEWSIAISDPGTGLAPEDQARLFEPDFRLVVSSESYLPTSTGLGMVIVDRLVKLLQGRIELVS
ncbi:MAG TPA: sensor histidine kinase, partial [Candidatus Obscuribacterales bacterium]